MKKINIIAFTIIAFTLLYSCSKDIAKPTVISSLNASGVDTCNTNIKYSKHIVPIILTSCARPGCHVAGGGLADFSSYTAIKIYIDANKTNFLNRIKPGGGMPDPSTTGPLTLNSCELSKIQTWIKEGYLQN